jgi:hypothetical protein
VRPAIPKLKSRACDQIFYGAGDQDLIWTSQSSNARTDMHRNPDHLVTRKFAFAGVQSGAYLSPNPWTRSRIEQAHRIARAGPSKVASKPSPAVSTSRPRKALNSLRTVS